MRKASEEKVKTVREITINHFRNGVLMLQWLAKARGLNDVRSCMSAVHIRRGYAFATDGSRFHLVVNDCFGGKVLPKGDYEVSRQTKNEITLREAKERVWPEKYSFKSLLPDCSEFKSIELQLSPEYAPGYAYAKLMRVCPLNFNYDYFMDMFPAAERMNVYYSVKNEQVPIVAHSDKGRDGAYIVVVMPLSY